MTARKTPAQDAATEVINQMQDAIEGKAAGTPLVVGVMLDDPFPKSLVGMLPRTSKRPAMEYVGHGAVTRRLLAVDPEWTWEPMGYASDGTAAVERDAQGRPIGLWIKLTVNGVTRPGYGDCESGQFSAMKVLIGDALRNAAMRFGVALDLWIRGQGEDDEQHLGRTQEQDNRPPPDPEPMSPAEEENLKRYRAIMDRAGALKKIDEAYIVGLRERATAAGFQSVNDWGRAHTDDFDEAVTGLEELVKQQASGEPEQEGTNDAS